MNPDGDMDSQPTNRAFFDAPGTSVELRQPEEDDGTFDVRMPIATTGEVRNKGDEPLTRDELDGMARQIDERGVGVFLDHGNSDLGGMQRYSAVEKVGEWVEPEVSEREADDEVELTATARLMDPESLPNGVSRIREAIGVVKEQAKRDMSLSASIGWREDDSYPGGVDLMEASIVGIGADPRTTSQSATATVARAAVSAGADPSELVDAVRAAVEDERPLGPPEDPERFDSFDECVNALQDDEDLSESEAERICGSWEADKENQSHDMTDETEASADDADAETEEQNSDTDDATERAPEDFGLGDWASLMAAHFDGVEASDFMEAWDAFADDYVGGVDVDAWAEATATVTGADVSAVSEALADLSEMDDEGEEAEMDDDEDDEDDEQSADDADAEEQAADESDEEERGLADEVAELREQLDAIRNGEVAIEQPETDGEQTAENPETEPDTEDLENDWRQYST